MFGMIPYGRRRGGITPRDDFWDRDIEDMFDGFFNDSFMTPFFGPMRYNPIKADIRENEKEYIIDAELPGVDKKDIKIQLKDDILTIAVERNEQINEERENYIRRERRFGSYSRSFRVENVKNEGVKAKFNNGVLTIRLPKNENQIGRGYNIEIQ